PQRGVGHGDIFTRGPRERACARPCYPAFTVTLWAKPLAAVYAQRTDITAAERAIDSRVIEAGNKATPFIDEVIARQTSGDPEGARGAKSMTRVSSKRFRSARSAR
ncbi:hypothetical protein, partial [Paraburkholderia sp. MM5384-R2]|uniref:hypothetical protein n=1 Tax=Paraburkholderia sp. MM5384-R2 TaxID=2723097 RepID=UPI001C8650F7